jgi:hypothetical protein
VDVRRGKPLYTFGKWGQSPWKLVWTLFKKANIELPGMTCYTTSGHISEGM